MRFIIQKFLRTHASPITRMFSQLETNKEREVLYLLEDLHAISMNLREMSELRLLKGNRVARRTREVRKDLLDKIERNSAVLGSKEVEGAILGSEEIEGAILRANSQILQQVDMVNMKFIHEQPGEVREAKIPIW